MFSSFLRISKAFLIKWLSGGHPHRREGASRETACLPPAGVSDKGKQETDICALRSRLEEKDARIRELEEENRKLSASRQKLAEGIKKLLAQCGQEES